jgi:hypothetical protein
VVPLSTIQRRTLEQLGVRILDNGSVIWPAPISVRQQAEARGRKTTPVRKTQGRDATERVFDHVVVGSTRSRERVLQVAPLLAGVTQYIIESDVSDPATRRRVQQDLSIIAQALRGTRGVTGEARQGIVDAVDFLGEGRTGPAVLKLLAAHNHLADRLNELHAIIPRVERRCDAIKQSNRENRADFRKWVRELDQDRDSLSQFSPDTRRLERRVAAFTVQSRGFLKLAGYNRRRGIDQLEIGELGHMLHALAKEFATITNAERKKRWSADTAPASHLIVRIRQWGHVRYARSYALKTEVLREARNWEDTPRRQLFVNQVEWAANNLKFWSEDPNRVALISPWMRALAEEVGKEFALKKMSVGVSEAARLCRHNHFARAARELALLFPSKSA